MTLPAFQQLVQQFVAQQQLETSVPTRLLDLVSEVGEVSKEALKGSNYGRQPFHPTPEWANELGDVFFSLICVANSTHVDLELALHEVLGKYERRLAQKGDVGSA
ncbi:MAG: MazG nucleotide pyrophosphohydrolase domain-containing protein [Ardenticatenaceae bacterium]